ncbi:hypothetical protein G6F68_020317 [Rhizopus microsporus]|nr:hypothetical protein G6F68_020317 [Rhizopus microsporus]
MPNDVPLTTRSWPAGSGVPGVLLASGCSDRMRAFRSSALAGVRLAMVSRDTPAWISANPMALAAPPAPAR